MGVDAMEGVANPHNLTIRTALADADGVEARISDSGAGIPNDKLASIFNALRHNEAARDGVGTSNRTNDTRKLRRRAVGREPHSGRGVLL